MYSGAAGGGMYSGSAGRSHLSTMTTTGDGCMNDTDCMLLSALSSSSLLLPPPYCSALSLGSLKGIPRTYSTSVLISP